MYSKIQVMKEQEFSTRQVSRTIRISRNTISKFWEMKPEEYAEAYKAVNRMTALTAYEPVVVKWLETYPCMTAAQVRDWLEERHQLDAGERTVRRFVARIWERYGITRKEEPRRYIKLYFVVFTLSYSRYKWGLFSRASVSINGPCTGVIRMFLLLWRDAAATGIRSGQHHRS